MTSRDHASFMRMPSVAAWWLSLRPSPEMQLVLACARWPRRETDLAEIARRATAAIDWVIVRRLLERHRIVGLGTDALLSAQCAMPAGVQAYCVAARQKVALTEMRAASEARRLIAAFRQQGIAARLLKGPAVSLLAFGKLGLRTNRDIDILIRPEDRPAAAAILDKDGYHRIEPAADISAQALSEWFINRKDMVYVSADGSMVELHWRLFDNVALLRGLEDAPAQRVSQGVFVFDTLPVEDNILYLCTHGAQHAWSRLKWLADVAALLCELDEEAIAALPIKARERRVGPAVAQALLLANRHMHVQLPDGLQHDLHRPLSNRFLVWVAERSLFLGNGYELEEQRFGSTWKNISHYMIATGWSYGYQEMRFDLFDLTAAGLPDRFRKAGPFARPLAAIVRRLSRKGRGNTAPR